MLDMEQASCRSCATRPWGACRCAVAFCDLSRPPLDALQYRRCIWHLLYLKSASPYLGLPSSATHPVPLGNPARCYSSSIPPARNSPKENARRCETRHSEKTRQDKTRHLYPPSPPVLVSLQKPTYVSRFVPSAQGYPAG